MGSDDLIARLQAEKSDLRGRVAELQARAEFVEAMIAEIQKMDLSAAGRAKRGGAPPAQAVEAPKPPRRKRRKPVKAEVSAAEAVLRLLAGCKMGLPAAEIVAYVTKAYGYRENSLRTTLYNLKKRGAVVQDDTGMYNHPANLG